MYLTCNHNWEFPSAGGQSIFLLEAAGCWIQTTNPSCQSPATTSVRLHHSNLVSHSSSKWTSSWEKKKKKAQWRFIQKECVTCACSQHIYAYFLCCHPRINFLVFPPSDFTIILLLSDSKKLLFYCFQLSFHGFLDTLHFSADGFPSEPVPKCDSASKSCPVSSTGILLQVTSWQLFSERGRCFPLQKYVSAWNIRVIYLH